MNDGLSVHPGEPLSRHTALRTGGPCGAWVIAHDLDGLALAVQECRREGWRLQVLGAATRTVVRDGPCEGAVLRLGREFARLERHDDHQWVIGAAFPVPALVAAAEAAGLSGVEFLATVPGSVGASLHHDPGWHDIVQQVLVLHRGARRGEELDDVRRHKRVILGVRLQLAADQKEQVVRRTAQAWVKGRPAPPGAWYAPMKRGSLRRVLRSVQLPQVRLRQVAIPDAAPELMINLGSGTAADLALLHRSATDRVKQVRGESLTSCIRWIGSRVNSESS